jgi:uncharacterized membrane protein YidH (DUF202 family)
MSHLIERLTRRWIPTLIATIFGALVLLGYLFPDLMKAGDVKVHEVLIEWAVIVAAFALLLGMLNILRVQGRQLLRRQKGGLPRLYSLVLLLASALTCATTVVFGPSGKPTQQMLEYVISPLGASLAALVAFTLALAAFRLLRTRRSWQTVVFIVVVALTLWGSTPLLTLEPGLISGIRDWVANVLGMAGMRGLLLGVALGTVITALRVLSFRDRPHSES